MKPEIKQSRIIKFTKDNAAEGTDEIVRCMMSDWEYKDSSYSHGIFTWILIKAS